MNLKLNGIPTSSGIAIGQIHQLKETVSLPVEKQGKGIDFEFNRFKKALSTAKDELNTLYLEALSKVGENEASILDAQKLMLEDPLLIDSTFQRIQADHLSAEFAFRLTMSELIDLFDVSDNLYTKERASDLKDLQRRVLLILAGL